MLQIPERNLLGTSPVRAGTNTWAESSAWFIRWFADVPLLALLIYFFRPEVVIFWPVVNWILKKFSIFIAQAGMAAFVIAAVNWVFNYPFTALIVWQFQQNPILGMIVWSVAGVAVNYGCLLWYKNTETDWFGLEWLRMQESIESEDMTGKILRFFQKNSKILVFGALSLFLDPIYGFMYQRGRVSGSRFDLNDWWWFILANIIGMLPWILGAFAIVEIGQVVMGWAAE